MMELINEILVQRTAEIQVTIRGWRQSSEYYGGTNPWDNDVTHCGVITSSEETCLLGKIVKVLYHGSYNGVYRRHEFLSNIEECHDKKTCNDESSKKLYAYMEGEFAVRLHVSYNEMPQLQVWQDFANELQGAIDNVLSNRQKPCARVAFKNWGYKRPETFEEYPYIPGETERDHYRCGCILCVIEYENGINDSVVHEIYDVLRQEYK